MLKLKYASSQLPLTLLCRGPVNVRNSLSYDNERPTRSFQQRFVYTVFAIDIGFYQNHFSLQKCHFLSKQSHISLIINLHSHFVPNYPPQTHPQLQPRRDSSLSASNTTPALFTPAKKRLSSKSSKRIQDLLLKSTSALPFLLRTRSLETITALF